MKLLKALLIVLVIVGVAAYLFWPWGVIDRAYSLPAWWQKSLFSFCKYDIPSNFKVVAYKEGAGPHKGEKYLICLANQDTSQLIVLSKLRGFEKVGFLNLNVEPNSKVGTTFRFDSQKILPEFEILTQLPIFHFLLEDRLDMIPDNLTLKGISVEKEEKFETKVANVFYIKGSFQKIGLFKKMPFPQGFATPVLDFLTLQKGAVAILNNKDAEETIIVVSSAPTDKSFDEATFKKFISYITFDKEIYKPALLEGVKELPKPKVKYGF